MDRRAGATRLERPIGPVAAVAMALCLGPLHSGPAAAEEVDELRKRLAQLQADSPPDVPAGTLRSIGYHLDVAERIERSFAEKSVQWRQRAARYLEAAEQGRDPYPDEKGKITNRGYRSPLSTITPGYAIYIPPDYDPAKPWPLYVALHGGSSNGNLFLGVVLGNNMDWKKYKQHLWDEYEPRWSPDWIVVAPTGFGQVMWRWMGEKDVLDVIADVKRHYDVDENRVVLGGLSNGGVGAYAVGLRHAWRFSTVQAMAGAPSWIQYGGRRFGDALQRAVEPWSGLHLAENSVNTDFRYYHGRTDPGPMRPPFVKELTSRLQELEIEPNVTWYDTGHDILYIVHKHGRIYEQLAEVSRDPRPRAVRVVTGDFRANRQHWLAVTRFDRYPELARAEAELSGPTLRIDTDNARALVVHVRDVPVDGDSDRLRIVVDDGEAYDGARDRLGHRLHLRRRADGSWTTGYPAEADGELHKRPGLSGPLTDAYYGRMVHVYGTQNEEHTDALEKAAQKGARGWPVWLWYFRQQVVADTDVTDELMRSAHLVLYGTPGDNSVLDAVAEQLPVRIDEDAITVGKERHAGRHVGTRFIYPNPRAPDRYLIVQAGTSIEAVRNGHKLPDFLPDYVVYDETTTRRRPRLSFGSKQPLALGYFDRRWRLPDGGEADVEENAEAKETPSSSGDEAPPEGAGSRRGSGPGDGGPSEKSALAPPTAPPKPAPPERFAAPASDPAGRVARWIARRVRTFENFRAKAPGGRWHVDEAARWSVRPQRECMRALRRAGVPARPQPQQKTAVPSPVELLGPVGGVWFRSTHDDRPVVMSCEMAARLPALVQVLRRHGVRGVDLMSALRDRPRASFHTMGLGLDLARLWTRHGWLSVQRHFAETPEHETCEAPEPESARARALKAIACELAETKKFSTILTPNYNEGHRDHFHLDARPDDPRIFVR